MELQLVDVAIGLFAAFFFLAIISSAVVELGSNLLGKRSKDLDEVLAAMLGDVSGFKATSTYQTLSSGSSVATAKARRPSYLSARSFADGVIEATVVTRRAGQTAADLINGLPDSPVKQRLQTLYAETGGDVTRVKAGLESWFDDTMNRMQGAYRRWSQWALLVVGFAVAAALNVSAVRIVDTLWSDGVLRSAVVGAAPQIAEGPCPDGETDCAPEDKITSAFADLDTLELPIGWGGGWAAESGALWTILGWLLGAIAAKAGAPFWFDLLVRLTGVRSNRGVPPKAADDGTSHTTAAVAGISTGTLDALIDAFHATRGVVAHGDTGGMPDAAGQSDRAPS